MQEGLGQLIYTAVTLGIIGFLAGDGLDKSRELSTLKEKLQNQNATAVYVDRDTIPDIVFSDGRILLGDQTNEGIKYRSLTSSDRYRITF